MGNLDNHLICSSNRCCACMLVVAQSYFPSMPCCLVFFSRFLEKLKSAGSCCSRTLPSRFTKAYKAIIDLPYQRATVKQHVRSATRAAQVTVADYW